MTYRKKYKKERITLTTETEKKMRDLLERRIFDGPIMASDPDLIGIEAACSTDATITIRTAESKVISGLMKGKSKLMMEKLKEKSAKAKAARMERGYMIDHDYEREKDEIRRRMGLSQSLMDLTGVFDGKKKPEKDVWEKLADGEI